MNKIQSTTQKWIEKDRRIWVIAKSNMPNPQNDAFLQAKVNNINQKQIGVNLILSFQQKTFDNKIIYVNYEDCQKLTYGPNDVSDMVDLQELNQPQLLYNLKRRYMNDLIFTFCGPTLVIINPYAYIQKLFNQTLLLQYQTYVFCDNLQYKTLPPHIFSLSAFCLWQLFQNLRNQSIVISGQSGSGKTQNTKYCLKFLASLGKNMKGHLKQKSSKLISTKTIKLIQQKDKLSGIQDKILGCNQILQAFGNAKTIRNDNSSRFGKLILLLYGQTQVDIRSGFIVSYLLQKSRIVSISEGQRNYHIFYYILRGTSEQQKKQYRLTQPLNMYKYLNQSTVSQIKGVSDIKKFSQVYNQFQSYFSLDQTKCIFKIVSTVLNMGNLIFKKQLSKNNEEMAVVVNKQYLQIAADLLHIDYEPFQHCFHIKTRKMGASVINSPLRFEQALALQGSFSKNLYERAFSFLVTKLNQKIQLQKINLQQSNKGFRKSIGLLDIFGFQVLGMNSLQQFFINFANQKLQQLYVSYIFKQQQNQFLKQGLKQFSHDIGFQDNKPVIDLFQLYPLGIFHLINQSSQLNKPDDDLPDSIVKNHPKNPFVQIPKSKKGIFLISHSCSPVNYQTAGFTSRNKDQFPQQLLDVIMQSNNQTLKTIIGAEKKPVDNKLRNASKKFLGSKFLNEMNRLTQELYSSDCHFVRCIKPNSKKSPKYFDSQAVLQSLRYLGVLDSILIRKLGYIYRRPFKQFIKKFFEIQQYIYNWKHFTEGKSQQDYKQYSKNFILKFSANELASRQILMGHKKILIKQSALNHFEAMAKQKRKMRIQCANKIKQMYQHATFRTQVKNFLQKIKILKIHLLTFVSIIRQKIKLRKCKKIQKCIKKFLLQRRLQKIKQQAIKSVTRISSIYKMKKQRKIFLNIKDNVIKIQKNIRFYLSMCNYIKVKNCRQVALYIYNKSWEAVRNRKATYIQKMWKGCSVRRSFKKVMEGIRKKLRIIKYKDIFMKVIFHKKYNKYIKILDKYRNPIIKMQALVRGKFCRRAYLACKTAAIVIQKAYRRHLKKKYYLMKLWKDYCKNLYQNQSKKSRQLQMLGIKDFSINRQIKYYPETNSNLMQYYPKQILNKYGKCQQVRTNWSINQSIQFPDKNTIQIYIADYDIIGNNSYKGEWLTKYIQVKEDLKRRNQYPIHVSFNQQFTSVISNKDKLYNFWADQKIQGFRLQIGGVPSNISASERSMYMIKNDQKIYTWGLNYECFIQKSKEDLVQWKNLINLQKAQIKQAFCKEQKRYFIDKQGKTYHYKKYDHQYKFQLSSIASKISIKAISLSYTFTIYLTLQGLLYSQGCNSKGQLGLGTVSNRPIQSPQAIPLFKSNKDPIDSISVGMAHCVAKSKLGYVYMWGDNCYSQISSKKIEYFSTPQLLENQQGKIKVFQAVAGARTSFILNDSLKIIGYGTSTTFSKSQYANNYQLQLLKQTSSSKFLCEIKLWSYWTRQNSILFVNAVDISRCKAGSKADIVLKYLKTIAKQWYQDKVYPQYHQWTDNILQLSDLRRFKFASTPKKKQKTLKSREKQQIQELKALVELRKNSPIFKRAALQKCEQLQRALNSKGPQDFGEEERQLQQYITQAMRVLK